MGLFNFQNLPVNTLVGADRKTFDEVVSGKEIDAEFRRKFRMTKAVERLMDVFYRINDRKYGKLKPLEGVEAPVFIIGHWRSGTTFVHNVLSKDPQFAYCSTYQTVFPHLMLWGRPFFRWCMKVVMPDSRPTDSLELNPDQPQEEEFALTNMTHCSYYHFWMFPRHIEEYRNRYLLMDGSTEDEVNEYKACQKRLIDTALHASGKKRFLSKNPPHTGRIRALLELYPDARFIHIVRNPYTVYKSTMSFVRNTLNTIQLQNISDEELENGILDTYSSLFKKYESDRELIPEGHLAEIRFEDFEKDPVGVAQQIYAKLNLGDFESVRPLMAEYAGEKKGFRKNRYQYDAHTIDNVNARWSEAIAHWGYEFLSKE